MATILIYIYMDLSLSQWEYFIEESISLMLFIIGLILGFILFGLKGFRISKELSETELNSDTKEKKLKFALIVDYIKKAGVGNPSTIVFPSGVCEILINPVGKPIKKNRSCYFTNINTNCVLIDVGMGINVCGDILITMKEMGYDLANKDDWKRAKKEESEKIVAEYEKLVKEKPELFDASKVDLNELEKNNEAEIVKDGLNCFICKNGMEILLEEFEKKKKKYKGKEDEYLDALTLDIEKKEEDEFRDMITEKGAHKTKKKYPSFIKDEAQVAFNLNTYLDWFRNYYHLENHHRYHYFSEKFYGITSKKSIVLCSVCKGYLEYCGYQPPYNLAYSRLTSGEPDMFKRDRFGNPENILKNTQYLFENVKQLKDAFLKCF